MQKNKKKHKEALPREELIKLVEELQKNKENLETQNNELSKAVKSKDQTLKSYVEHYDYAPVGYLTLDAKGSILSVNLTGCSFFGEERQKLINQSVTKFLDPAHKDTFENHIERIFSTGEREVCQVKVKYNGGSYIIELRSAVVPDGEGRPRYCRSSMFNVTERIQVAAELEEQRKLMGAVFEHIESSILVCSHDGNLTLLNKAATDLFGTNLTGIGCDEWAKRLKLYREDGETPLNKEEMPLFRAWKGEKIKNIEVNFIPEEGETRTLLVSGQPIYDQHGLNLGAVVALLDITDRKRTEVEIKSYQEQLEMLVEVRTRELRRANNQLSEEVTERSSLQKRLQTEKHIAESIISSHPGLFFLIDKQGRMHRWNKSLEYHTGYSREEIKKMTAFDLLDQKDLEILKFSLNLAFKEGHTGGKARLISKDGSKTPFLLNGVAIKLADQDFVIGTGIDITAIESERAEKMRFLQVLEKSKNEIFIFDANTNELAYVNAGARKNLGYNQEELMKMKAYDIKPDLSADEFQELVKPLINNEKEKIIFQSQHKRSDGSKYPVEVNLQLIEQENEKLFVAFSWDITNRLKAEERIKSALHEKEVLLKEIHHRVKNNLSIVSSLLTIQTSYVKDLAVKDLFIESESRVKSMAMIHELLYQQENFSEIDFDPYIRKLIHHISSNYKSPGLDIRTEVNIDDVFLEIGTAVPCALLVNELLTNAYKHAFKGRKKGIISISLVNEAGTIILKVEDDGVGLPPDINKINTLGMTLIHGLTNQLKGEIDIKNGNGAKFHIHFPQSI